MEIQTGINLENTCLECLQMAIKIKSSYDLGFTGLGKDTAIIDIAEKLFQYVITGKKE